jgi:hypothetical protein
VTNRRISNFGKEAVVDASPPRLGAAVLLDMIRLDDDDEYVEKLSSIPLLVERHKCRGADKHAVS